MSLRVLTPVLFVLGVALLVPFEAPVTLALGTLFLLAFVVCGTLAVAVEDEEEDARSGRGSMP